MPRLRKSIRGLKNQFNKERVILIRMETRVMKKKAFMKQIIEILNRDARSRPSIKPPTAQIEEIKAHESAKPNQSTIVLPADFADRAEQRMKKRARGRPKIDKPVIEKRPRGRPRLK